MKSICFSKLKFIATIIAVLFTFSASTAIAGQINKSFGKRIDGETYIIDTSIACTHLFSGVFQQGDAQKIIDAKPSLLCLNSKGGSLIEALKLTKHMKTNPIATKIRADAHCESACALVFMAGMFRPHESDGPMKWRVLNPDGKLGFHAPSLRIKAGAYDEAGVSKAYQVAMLSISKIVHDLVNRGGEAGSALAFSLLGDMLKTPANTMMYVETVDQAGRWKIEVGPINAPSVPSTAQLANICGNGYSWGRDESSVQLYNELDGSTDEKNGWSSWQNPKVIGENEYSGTIIVNEMSGDGCEITINSSQDYPSINLKYFYGGPIEFTDLMYFEPNLKLTALTQPTSHILNIGIEYGKCIVRKNGNIIDQENCDEKGTMEDGVKSYLYTWPSGSKTQFEMSANIVRINGNDVYDFVETKTSKCGTNPNSGNSFCFEWVNY